MSIVNKSLFLSSGLLKYGIYGRYMVKIRQLHKPAVGTCIDRDKGRQYSGSSRLRTSDDFSELPVNPSMSTWHTNELRSQGYVELCLSVAKSRFTLPSDLYLSSTSSRKTRDSLSLSPSQPLRTLDTERMLNKYTHSKEAQRCYCC